LSDKEFISRLRQGDESAFKYLVECYQDKIYNVILNILHNAIEAEDAAQETFIKVYESIHEFRGESSLKTWMYKIAIRKALGKLRNQKYKERLHLIMPFWIHSEVRGVKDVVINPGIKLEDKEQAATIFKAIADLPHNQRVAFTLVRVQGMKHEEVSDIMQLSIKAIESLLSRAKGNLKNKLKYYQKLS
jgi:RNA polymerase sigma factor (sigma-70 family)